MVICACRQESYFHYLFGASFFQPGLVIIAKFCLVRCLPSAMDCMATRSHRESALCRGGRGWVLWCSRRPERGCIPVHAPPAGFIRGLVWRDAHTGDCESQICRAGEARGKLHALVGGWESHMGSQELATDGRSSSLIVLPVSRNSLNGSSGLLTYFPSSG